LPRSATALEREQHLTELLSGRAAAAGLPLHHTSPEAAYDSNLYLELTTEPDARPPARGRP
jgi:hypothetical protein